MKVLCNGPEKHLNEINIEELLKPQPIVRGFTTDTSLSKPKRFVLQCRFCKEGRVIITQEMIHKFTKKL